MIVQTIYNLLYIMRHLLAIKSPSLPLNEPNLWNNVKPISIKVLCQHSKIMYKAENEGIWFISIRVVLLLGEPETDREEKPFLTRFKNWGTGVFNWPCYGRRVRQICIFGIGDLPLLARRPEFFANKFYLYYQTYALQCMEELHFNRTRDEYLQRLDFQTDYYENLEFIKHVV